MKNPFNRLKIGESRPLPARGQPGRGQIKLWQRPGNGDVMMPLILVFQRLVGRSSAGGTLYSPFIAADEKVLLSVVRVNKKPQHLVFCLHSQHLLSK